MVGAGSEVAGILARGKSRGFRTRIDRASGCQGKRRPCPRAGFPHGMDAIAAIASKMVGKTKASKAPKAAKVAVLKTKTAVGRKPKAVAVDDGSVPTVEVEEVGFDELASLKAELGLSDSYSE